MYRFFLIICIFFLSNTPLWANEENWSTSYDYAVQSIQNLEDYTGIHDTIFVSEIRRGGVFVCEKSNANIDNGMIFSCKKGKNLRWRRLLATNQINAYWYGATGNGKTDDSDAIENALKYAFANRFVVHIPQGVFMVSRSIILPAEMSTSGLTLLGDGSEKSVIRAASSFPGFLIDIAGGGSTEKAIRRGKIAGIQIDGGGYAKQDGGISMKWCYLWSIEDVLIKNFGNAKAIGFDIQNSFNICFRLSQANIGSPSEKKGTGLRIYSSPANGQNVTQIDISGGNLFQYNDIGIDIGCRTSGDGIVIENNACGKNRIGINISGGTIYGSSIRENHIEYNAIGVNIDGTARGLSISRNFFYSNKDIITTGIVINGKLGRTDNILIDGNVFQGTGLGHQPYKINDAGITLGDNTVYSTSFNKEGVLVNVKNKK